MKIVSLTLARGGSKEIKNKNLVKIKQMPLIYYQIKNCLSVSQISDSYVSSDSNLILKEAESFGAIAIKRPKEISGDTARCEESLLHFCDAIDFDVLVFAQATSPLVIPEDIEKGVKKFVTGHYDSVFSVTEEHWIPRWTNNLTPVGWDHFNRPRRQTMKSTLVENGAFYITSKDFLVKNKNRYGGVLGVIKIPLSRSFQLDTHEDLELIERLL